MDYMRWYIPVIAATWETEAEGPHVQGQLGQFNKTCLKKIKQIKINLKMK